MTPKLVLAHYQSHKKYWDERRPELRRLRAAYLCRYWNKAHTPDQILIETSRAYEFIEGYVASLFARSPAVVVKGDIRGNGDPEKVQTLINNYLSGIRQQIEDSTRLGLIYPCSFLKLVPNDHPDPFKRVTVSAVATPGSNRATARTRVNLCIAAHLPTPLCAKGSSSHEK